MAIKPEEYPELIKFIGYNPEEIESVDTFKKSFNEDFLKSSAYGQRIGSLESSLIKRFKAANIEFKPEEIKDKKVEDIQELGLKKAFEFFNSSLEAEKKKNKNPDEAIVKIQGEFDTYKSEAQKKINDEIVLRTQLKTEYDTFKSTVETEKKQSTVKDYENAAWKGFKWGTGIDDLRKKGFEATVKERYATHLDESGKPYTANEKGERIQSAKKTGEHATLEEILESEGIKAKVWAVADNKGGGAGQTVTRTTVKLGNEAGEKQPFIHPNAIAAVDKNPAPLPGVTI